MRSEKSIPGKPFAPTNIEISDVLERVAELLEAQDANPFRVRAYRRAAQVIERSEQSIAEIADSKNGKRLEDLPEIGNRIAGSILEFVHTGRLILLERLEGQVSPEDLFTTVPGIGEELAKRIHLQLHIETLEDLELAAHDGRLEKVTGLGERRIRGLRDSLATMLSRSSRRRARRIRYIEKERATGQRAETSLAPISVILEVDAEYRRKAEAGLLKTIKPRRFNPEQKSFLPILHTEREGLHFTALFSNTARAHEVGKTRDWVVVYYDQEGHENQCTVVTEHHGTMQGKRVVRGRELECMAYYGKNV
jgi:DNA polymerase (family 10)